MLEIKKISKVYNSERSNPVNALRGVNLSIKKGESIVITGPSGSGKSTLLQIIGCINCASSGEYLIETQNVCNLSGSLLAKRRNEYFGFVLQNFGLIKYRNVIDNMSLPLILRGNVTRKQIKEKCCSLLERTGLKGYENRKVWELSNGEQQRVAIARAVINNPSVVLADEPTGALDSQNRKIVMKLFDDINARGITVIVVTHDLSLVDSFKRHISLKDGYVISDKSNIV